MDGVFDVLLRQRGQPDRQGDDDESNECSRTRARDFLPEHEQRPVPEVQPVADAAQPDEGPAGEQPLGPASGRCTRSRDKDEHRGERGPERRNSRKLGGDLEHETAGEETGESDPAGDQPQGVVDSKARQDHRGERPQPELPRPREGAVVGGRLVLRDRVDREGERCDRDHGEGGDEDATGIRFPQPACHQPDRHEQGRPDEVELALHRHGPEVLHRRVEVVEREVVDPGTHQLPVLEVQRRCDHLGEGLLPLRGQQQHETRRRHHHEHHRRCRKQP